MKHLCTRTFLAGLIFVAASCSEPVDVLEHGADFESYAISGYESSTLNTKIDKENHTVFIQLPADVTDGSALTPIFTASAGASVTMNGVPQVSGTVALDYNDFQLYTVTAEDKVARNIWEVTVSNNNYTSSYGLGNFLIAGKSNDGKTDYYIQQQHSGTYSDNNCGPAVAVMAAKFVNPSYSGTVEQAREEALVSEVDGGVNWFPRDIYKYLWRHGAEPAYCDFSKSTYDDYVSTITSKIDAGCIAISCIKMTSITEAVNPNSQKRVHKYYPGTAGHFLLIKGYRKMGTDTWFEVHDPWGLDKKYEDGTPVGANRYYLASQVAKSIDWNYWSIVVPPKD